MVLFYSETGLVFHFLVQEQVLADAKEDGGAGLVQAPQVDLSYFWSHCTESLRSRLWCTCWRDLPSPDPFQAGLRKDLVLRLPPLYGAISAS